MPELVSLLPIVAIALLFWLLIIRPASRRQKDLARMQGSLTVGDDVMLTSGIFGRLTATDDDHLHVEVADGVVLRVARGAIASVVTQPPADDAPAQPTTQSTTQPTTEPTTEPTRPHDGPEEN